jgi:hypothetical protein
VFKDSPEPAQLKEMIAGWKLPDLPPELKARFFLSIKNNGMDCLKVLMIAWKPNREMSRKNILSALSSIGIEEKQGHELDSMIQFGRVRDHASTLGLIVYYSLGTKYPLAGY